MKYLTTYGKLMIERYVAKPEVKDARDMAGKLLYTLKEKAYLNLLGLVKETDATRVCYFFNGVLITYDEINEEFRYCFKEEYVEKYYEEVKKILAEKARIKNETLSTIPLKDNVVLVVKEENISGNNPEIIISLMEYETVSQDICIVRPNENTVECLVFGDESSEEYTEKFDIKVYREEQQ